MEKVAIRIREDNIKVELQEIGRGEGVDSLTWLMTGRAVVNAVINLELP
jgi:hypothetical protein